MTSYTRRALFGCLALVAAVTISCSSDDDADDSSGTGRIAGSTTAPAAGPDSAADTPTGPDAEGEVLRILVSNDDGYDAEGIDALVEGLVTMENVEVIVYAPLEQRSATGGTRTDGETAVSDVELASGHPAKAVDGFPSDAVRTALETDGVEAHVVISGINEGQNLGPMVDISGTVGAARVGVANGIPAVAVSQGSGTTHDYPSAVTVVLDWVRDNRDAILDGSAPVEVVNVNVPSCDSGMLRGLVDVEPDLDGDPGTALGFQDCTATGAVEPQTEDMAAFLQGFVTISVVPAEPAVPVTIATTVPAA